DDPADTIPRVNWPEVPEIAHVPAEAAPGAAPAADARVPVASFACPACGQPLAITRPANAGGDRGRHGPGGAEGRAASNAPHAQVGALARPGSSAPSPDAKPGPASADTARATAAVEPGPSLAGDEWLDPPLPAAGAAAGAKASPRQDPKGTKGDPRSG